jgi:transcriptional regulator with XRE-family HTH domain
VVTSAGLPDILGIGMISLVDIGSRIASARRALKLSQKDLAAKAGIARSTLEALENGRTGELGFSKLTRVLAELGLDLALTEENRQRPTLDQLRAEDRDDA